MKRTILLALVALAALPAAASARIPIRVAIGDQQIGVFDQSAFQSARVKRIRYLVPWNVMDNATQRLPARAYLQRARAEHMQVFLHITTDDYTIKKAKLPSTATYRRQIRRIVNYFRGLGVREFGTWDEANHASQPTWDT